jgi:hypothetical protein
MEVAPKEFLEPLFWRESEWEGHAVPTVKPGPGLLGRHEL